MGRTAIDTPEQDKPAIDGELLAKDMASQINALAAVRDNAVALAKQLNYEGALTVGGLEEEIKFYQRRSVEAVLETGKRLLLLKEITEHGGFMASLEGLGISQGLANKFMSATVKFSKSSTSTILTLPNINHSKLLELMVLDEGEIDALADGGTVRGLKLDDVDCMSVSELRTALRKTQREQQEELAAKAEMLRRRDERINNLEEENARLTGRQKAERTPAMEEEERLRFMSDHGLMLVREIEVGLRSHFALLDKLFPEGVRPNHVQLAQQQAVSQVIQAARVLAGDYGILLQQADIERPDLLWLTQGEALFGAAPDSMLDGADSTDEA